MSFVGGSSNGWLQKGMVKYTVKYESDSESD